MANGVTVDVRSPDDVVVNVESATITGYVDVETPPPVNVNVETAPQVDLSFDFTQALPASVWVIPHNLGKFPSVTVTDSADTVVIGDVQYLDVNTVQVSFIGSFAGKAHLN